MNIFLGNTQFNQVEDKLGYKLNDDDKSLWDEFHCQSATLSKERPCFHVFDIPTCIKFKGKEAGDAILKMFTSDKLVKSIGTFTVYEVK